MAGTSARTVTPFSPTTINRLRNKIQKMQEPLRTLENGWSPSPVDPNRILALFPTLRLRDECRLIAFQFKTGGNGNGVVLTWPKDTPVPELPPGGRPDLSLEDHLTAHLQFHLKMEGWQIENYLSRVIMRAIEGDGSPRSYFEASLFGREIYEFGAMWHGSDWRTHHIVDKDPFTDGVQTGGFGTGPREVFLRDEWTSTKELPQDWTPRVTMTAKQSRVEFYTFSGLIVSKLSHHRDTYMQGNYQCRTKMDTVAQGPPGYIF